MFGRDPLNKEKIYNQRKWFKKIDPVNRLKDKKRSRVPIEDSPTDYTPKNKVEQYIETNISPNDALNLANEDQDGDYSEPEFEEKD